MLEATFTPGGARAPAASPAALIGVRWQRVLAVAAMLAAMFYVIEHDTSAAIGAGHAGVDEADVRDVFIDKIEGGSSSRRLAFFAFGVFGVVALRRPDERPWNVRWVCVTLLGVFLLWVAMGVFVSDDPALLRRRLAALSLVLIGSLGVARILRPNELMSAVLISFSVLIANSMLVDLASGGRPWSSGYRFSGTLHPNIQAAYCAVLAIAAYCHPAPLGWRWARRVLLGSALLALYLTESRTAVLAVAVGLLMAFMVRLRPSIRWTAATGLASVAAMLTILFASLGDDARAELLDAVLLGRHEQTSSLNGRVPLWDELGRYAAKAPIQGYGYSTFWTPDRIAAVMKTQHWALQSAHNAYLELVLQVGFVGAAMGVALVLIGWNLNQMAFAKTKQAGYAFVYGVFAFAMLNSLLEAHFAKLKYPTVVCVIALFSVLFFYPKENEERRA